MIGLLGIKFFDKIQIVLFMLCYFINTAVLFVYFFSGINLFYDMLSFGILKEETTLFLSICLFVFPLPLIIILLLTFIFYNRYEKRYKNELF